MIPSSSSKADRSALCENWPRRLNRLVPCLPWNGSNASCAVPLIIRNSSALPNYATDSAKSEVANLLNNSRPAGNGSRKLVSNQAGGWAAGNCARSALLGSRKSLRWPFLNEPSASFNVICGGQPAVASVTFSTTPTAWDILWTMISPR